MKEEFFSVVTPEAVFSHLDRFSPVSTEPAALDQALGRVVCEDICAGENIPGFDRAVMDGFAVRAASTFGASELNPAYLTLKGLVVMGEVPDFAVGPGEAAAIATGGMLPRGADSVVPREFTQEVDATTVEVHKPVAPGAHMVAADEDFKKGDVVIVKGTRLRSQELGVLAALGIVSVPVYRKPVVGIIPTGDEVVAVEKTPPPGCIRDVNTHTLAGLVTRAGGAPVLFDLVADDREALRGAIAKALEDCDMVMLSGGSSVGARDFTIAAMEDLPDARVLVHGVGMRPGKPTILAKAGHRAVWGLPGQVASAMVVFMMIVRPFVEHIGGVVPVATRPGPRVTARLWRNVPSVQGRVDYVRVKLVEKDGVLWAQPVFGKSGLLNTMTWADGVIEIDANTEGLNAGEPVGVVLF